jgi:HD superfamily phosphohydrolase
MAGVGAEYRRVNLSSDPLYGYVRVTKPGGVPGEVAEQDLIDNVWLRRLRLIHQLQTAWWVYATAEHSRFQHSLGSMHLAGEWGKHLYPTLREHHPDLPSRGLIVEILRLAGLLHDIGHGPFGHFFDQNYLCQWGINHEDIGRELILRQLSPLIKELRAAPDEDFAPGEQIDPTWVAYLISHQDLPQLQAPAWLTDLKPAVIGPFSADNMDYVPRDAYICGVAVGAVDVQRIIHYSFFSEQGLSLHMHGSEALFMFLSARLFLYQQVYFHRTVRRIDLQLREVFRPTMEILLGGNPLEQLARFERLNEWYLLVEVDRWARGEGNALQRELGGAWADLTERRLKWQLVYSAHAEAGEAPSKVFSLGPAALAARIRELLPPEFSDLEFEVDIASQESQSVNPLAERGDILLYDPLEENFQHSRVLDLFQRLPERMALLRIFARDERGRTDLARAVRAVVASDHNASR